MNIGNALLSKDETAEVGVGVGRAEEKEEEEEEEG